METMNSSQESWSKRKGGFRAATFVYALTFLDSIGSIATTCIFVLYFYAVMHFDLSTAANTFTNYMGSTYLLSIVGGFISDTYLTRLNTCLSFGLVQVTAQAMIAYQAYSKSLHPPACGNSSCLSGGKALLFYSSLSLLALGAGAVRGTLAAFGGDQFDPKDHKGAKALARFFNGYVLSSTVGAALGVTFVIWVFMNKGWYWGFVIATITSSIGYLLLGLGKPFYRIQPLGTSPITRVAQVIWVAFRNRSLSLPELPADLYEIDDERRVPSEEKVLHSNQFRWLDRAAILQEGQKPETWRICTVTQVEEVKIVTRMLPILASTFIMNTCLAQLQTFSVLQGYFMDRHLGSFEIPSASIPVVPLLFMSILIPIYEFLVVPFARKITGHPGGITQLQRIGVGLVLSIISMTIAGFVEVKRRDQSQKDFMKPISLFWLSFQYGIFGIADMFTLVGLLEFFYREAPSGMKSLATSFAPLSLSIGYFLSTIFVKLFNSVTKRISRSKQGWLDGQDLDMTKLDRFYWFLAVLSCLNFGIYLLCAWWYKYKNDGTESQKKNMAAVLNGSPSFVREKAEEQQGGEELIQESDESEKYLAG